jgi:hypothetical protein
MDVHCSPPPEKVAERNADSRFYKPLKRSEYVYIRRLAATRRADRNGEAVEAAGQLAENRVENRAGGRHEARCGKTIGFKSKSEVFTSFFFSCLFVVNPFPSFLFFFPRDPVRGLFAT